MPEAGFPEASNVLEPVAMEGQRIDGKAVAAKVRDEVAAQAAAFTQASGRPPGLQVVLIGDDPASQVYVRNKERASEKVGIAGGVHRLPSNTPESEVLALVERLNNDDQVDGILVQMPLPAGLSTARILGAIDPLKDVDGLSVANAGRLAQARPGLRPCTPAGCMRLLKEIGCDPAGRRALVIGRSDLVGKPMAQLLLQANATVTMAHSRSQDLAGLVAEADIVVAAVGKQNLVLGAWLKPGAVVLDVGMNRNEEGKLCGDVEWPAALERASFATPVPGGVGPMTIAMLLQNTVEAAYVRTGVSRPVADDTPAG